MAETATASPLTNPTLEIFGAWAHHGEVLYGPVYGPVYVITARCDTRCHVMRQLISADEIETIRVPDALWDHMEDRIRDAFARVHG